MSIWRSERGAAAVEFALVVPVLLALVLGIIEFGRAYNTQISLTHAAREAARAYAVGEEKVVAGTVVSRWDVAVQAGRKAAPSLDSANMDFGTALGDCAAGSMVNIAIEYPLTTITGIADDMTLTGKAAMRCGG